MLYKVLIFSIKKRSKILRQKYSKGKSLTQQSIQNTRPLGNPLKTVYKMSLTQPHVDGSLFIYYTT